MYGAYRQLEFMSLPNFFYLYDLVMLPAPSIGTTHMGTQACKTSLKVVQYVVG